MRNNYNTRQRQLILSCLKRNKAKHITAEKIFEFLNDLGNPVGQTTIYRNLNKMEKEGLVLKYVPAQGLGACYQYVGDGDTPPSFYHLICVDCGQMIHLKCDYMDELKEHMRDHHSFNLDSKKTVLYGRCDECNSTRNFESGRKL